MLLGGVDGGQSRDADGFADPLSLRCQLGQTEVQDLREPTLGDEDICWLNIPMDAQLQHFLRAERLTSNAVLQCLPIQKLHGDEMLALVFVNLMNGADIGVIQRRGGTGFALQSLKCVTVPGQLFWKKLQSH